MMLTPTADRDSWRRVPADCTSHRSMRDVMSASTLVADMPP
jgi:hypothetical protein